MTHSAVVKFIQRPSSTEVKIEKGIPIPEKPKGGNRGKYPWDELNVGDSFFSRKRELNLPKLPGKKFTTRKEGDGLRVWRIL